MADATDGVIVLTDEQRELVSALDGLGLGFAYTDGARVLFASSTYADMVGYSVDQVLTMSDPFLMIAPEDRDRARAYTIEWMSGRPVAPSLEVRLETATGEAKRVLLAVQRVTTEGGRSHVLVIIVDLDASARYNASHHDLARLARAIADGTREPFMVLRDDAPRVLMANRAARELSLQMGWSRSSAPSPVEVLAAAGVRDPGAILDEARLLRAPTQVMGMIDQVRYEIAVFPTPRGCVLWWREIGVPRSPTRRDMP